MNNVDYNMNKTNNNNSSKTRLNRSNTKNKFQKF